MSFTVSFSACLSSSEGDKSCQWISSKEQLQDGGFQFELAHSLSPYAEESTMLIVTAEAISDLSIVRKTKRFYLRDIGELSETEWNWAALKENRHKIIKIKQLTTSSAKKKTNTD